MNELSHLRIRTIRKTLQGIPNVHVILGNEKPPNWKAKNQVLALKWFKNPTIVSKFVFGTYLTIVNQ